MDDVLEAPKSIVIPYTPRAHFRAAHADRRRWLWFVVHRRGGKTVFIVNHLVRACLMNPRVSPPPRYAYVGPSFAQAKDIVWGYIKQYTSTIPGMTYSESELSATFPNGGKISLYGGSGAYERMRGLYFDGVALDEYPLLHPEALNSVVRPCLSDYRGFGIVSGTSAGKDHFYALRQKWSERQDTHGIYDIKVSDTDALHPDEVEEAKQDMTHDAFQREYMNNFDSAVEGAYYADEIANAYEQGRVCGVPYDKSAPVMTCWDLGLDDETAVWYFQRVGREIHWIDYQSWTNKALGDSTREVLSKPYDYARDGHIFPHDVAARELTSGVRRLDFLRNMGVQCTVAPRLPVEDGINAVRSLLSVSWFDKVKTERGLSCLAAYQSTRSKERDTNNPKPLHNWASHGSDAMRTGATGVNLVLGWGNSLSRGGGLIGALRRNIGGII